jgi:predicted amidohydrolase
MDIVLIQFNIAWGNPEANVQRVEELMAAHRGADLYVLPEMWATGFATQPEGLAEEEGRSVALQWMKRTALRENCAICGSLAVRTADGHYRNRHYFVMPGQVTFYDKHHLFTHGHEHETYTAGNAHTVVEWRGVRFLLLTCYDLRFPVWARYGWAGEYDAIVYVANWPQSRMQAWEVLTHARAIENRCYVIAVNRVGDDAACHYAGGSMLIDPIGRTVEKAMENAEQLLHATLSMDELRKARERFRVLADRDCHPIV